MTDYNRKHPRDCSLPQTVYNETIATARNYDYYKSLYSDAIDIASVEADGMPKGSGISNPTMQRAIKAERWHDKIEAIEQSINVVPPMHQRIVFDNAVRKAPFPHEGRRTYGRWKQVYLYELATRLGLI